MEPRAVGWTVDALPGVWGNSGIRPFISGEQKYKTEGNREQKQFWGTGNIENQILILENMGKCRFFQGNKGTCIPGRASLSDRTVVQVCVCTTYCDRLNFSNITQSSFSSCESRNNFSELSEETPSPHFSPIPTTTTRVAQPRRNPTAKASKLRVLNKNCQSLANKKQTEFYSLLDTNKPDIVIGTESRLTSTHTYSEIFPQSLGYTPFRQDREKDAMGGRCFYIS